MTRPTPGDRTGSRPPPTSSADRFLLEWGLFAQFCPGKRDKSPHSAGGASAVGHSDVPAHRPRGVNAPVGAGPRGDEGGDGPPRRNPREDHRRASEASSSSEWATGSRPHSARPGTRSTAPSRFNHALTSESWRTAQRLRARIGCTPTRASSSTTRIRQPADQPLLAVDVVGARWTGRPFRNHRGARARSAPRWHGPDRPRRAPATGSRPPHGGSSN